MYYETRVYNPENVVSAIGAAMRIKSGHAPTCGAFYWETDKGRVYVVDDSHCDGPFLEVAVIMFNGLQLRQIESITAGWIKTESELAKYFEKAVKYPSDMGVANLNLNYANVGAKAWFECGCCGSSFKGEVKYQLGFDQDNGYGICPGCEMYYK